MASDEVWLSSSAFEYPGDDGAGSAPGPYAQQSAIASSRSNYRSGGAGSLVTGKQLSSDAPAAGVAKYAYNYTAPASDGLGSPRVMMLSSGVKSQAASASKAVSPPAPAPPPPEPSQAPRQYTSSSPRVAANVLHGTQLSPRHSARWRMSRSVENALSVLQPPDALAATQGWWERTVAIALHPDAPLFIVLAIVIAFVVVYGIWA